MAAAAYFLSHLLKICPTARLSNWRRKAVELTPRSLQLRPSRCERLIGLPFGAGRCADLLESLEFGVQTSAWGGNVQTRMSYGGPGLYVPPDDSPKSAFERMFGDIGQCELAAASGERMTGRRNERVARSGADEALEIRRRPLDRRDAEVELGRPNERQHVGTVVHADACPTRGTSSRRPWTLPWSQRSGSRLRG